MNETLPYPESFPLRSAPVTGSRIIGRAIIGAALAVMVLAIASMTQAPATGAQADQPADEAELGSDQNNPAFEVEPEFEGQDPGIAFEVPALPTEVGPPEAQAAPAEPTQLPTEPAAPPAQNGADDESASADVPDVEVDIVAECQGIEATIVGTDADDVLVGTNERDVIFAGPGDDVIRALGGDDIICGAGGNDTIDGGTGFDWILGGAGADRLRGGAGTDMLRGGPDDDVLAGGPNRDVLIGNTGTDLCIGGQGNDRADRCEETRGVQTLDGRTHAGLELLMTERINLLRTDAGSFAHPDGVTGTRSAKRVGLDKRLEAISEAQAVALIADGNRDGALSEDLGAALGPNPDRNASGQVVFTACGPYHRADLINQLFFVAIEDGQTFESLIVRDFDKIGVAIVRGNGCWYAIATFEGLAN